MTMDRLVEVSVIRTAQNVALAATLRDVFASAQLESKARPMIDREALLAEIKNQHWYQSIPLGPDFTTDGETGTAERDKIAMMNLPDDLTGTSVLDIGCNEGFYSFELEARGASPILAIDQHPAARKKFELIHLWKDSQAEFRPCDFFDLRASEIGTHDIVLFLAVFHHVRHPLLAIDRIHELTEIGRASCRERV